MSKNNKVGKRGLPTNSHKNTSHRAQMQIIFNYLKRQTSTASMATEATGVPQKCICRYKRDLEKSGHLWVVKEDRCKITGFIAQYLTTDPKKAPKRQPTLFDGMEGQGNG